MTPALRVSCVCAAMGFTHGVVLSAMSALLAIWTLAFLCLGSKFFPPLKYVRSAQQGEPPNYLYTSAMFALPASVIALVALPVYAFRLDNDAYFACACAFYVAEGAWLPVNALDLVPLVRAVLFLAACALTAAIGVAFADLSDGEDCPLDAVYFLIVMAVPFANVWLNDLVYYTYKYQQSQTATGYRGGINRGRGKLRL